MQPNQMPPPGFAPAPPGGDYAKLESDTTLWLVVAAAGWFTGTMWITGPLAWYMGNQLCARYRAFGQAPSSNATIVRLVGMITTIISIAAIALGCFALLGGGLFAVLARR